MNNYYIIGGKAGPGIAYACSRDDSLDLFDRLPDRIRQDTIQSDFNFKKAAIIKGEPKLIDDLTGIKHFWIDLQPNNLALPLMSERMKEIVSAQLTGREGIKWVKVLVTHNLERRTYYVARFQRKLDVLDEENTVFAYGTDHVVIPTLSSKKIAEYAMFHIPNRMDWQVPSGLYVNEAVKEAIQEARLKWVTFEKAEVT